MSFNQYENITNQRNKLEQDLLRLDNERAMIEKTPQFKDEKIRMLEKRVKELEEELKPHRAKAAQKRIDAYGSMKCTNKLGCGCRDCHDL